MRKTLATIAAISAIGAFTLPATAPARADSAGAAIAAGIGGFALGAIAGGALAQPGPPPVVYVEPPPPPPHCWIERRPVFDEYGEVIGSRPRRFCE
jgi:hypothetical protein